MVFNEHRLRTNIEIESDLIKKTQYQRNIYNYFLKPGLLTSNKEDANTKSKTKEIEQEKNKFHKIISLWDMFYDICKEIKSIKLCSKTSLALLDKLLKNSINLFKKVYFEQEITPYMHLVCCHSTELNKKHREINNYNLQGLEKYNDITTISYHRSKNRHIKNKEFLRTLIIKRNRTEFKLLGFSSNLEIKNLGFIVNNLLSNIPSNQSTVDTSQYNIYLIKDLSSYNVDQESWLSDLHIDYVLNKLQNKYKNIFHI